MLHIYAYEIDWRKKYEDLISLEQEKTSLDMPNRDIRNNCFETKIKLCSTTWHTQWIIKSNKQTNNERNESTKNEKRKKAPWTMRQMTNRIIIHCRADTSTLHTGIENYMSTDWQWFLLSLCSFCCAQQMRVIWGKTRNEKIYRKWKQLNWNY